MAQSRVNKKFLQKDGWGVASFQNGRVNLLRSALPIWTQEPRLKLAARRHKARITIAHIRKASNPLGLPRRELIAVRHNQPFTDSGLIFAHNGTLNIAAEVREKLLGPMQRHVKGNNDSEVYFWLVAKWRAKVPNVPEALRNGVREIWSLWRSLSPAQRKKWKYPYTSLNALISDGRNFFALCDCARPPHGKSLCLQDQPYGDMAYRIDDNGSRLIMGSEKMSPERGWNLLTRNRLLSARLSAGGIKFTIEPFRRRAK